MQNVRGPSTLADAPLRRQVAELATSFGAQSKCSQPFNVGYCTGLLLFPTQEQRNRLLRVNVIGGKLFYVNAVGTHSTRRAVRQEAALALIAAALREHVRAFLHSFSLCSKSEVLWPKPSSLRVAPDVSAARSTLCITIACRSG